ncbi:histidinol phosphate phosphatase domain-containing protein [Candidatus Saganbacteria bacterium]|uniref:Histidinol phosphate phosphatase domain-containing protein n=1 Tax=Candidatus Saganbacteria bacterium TaxID=2575572 RepID=A0A9D6YUU3_UNCSA|nr:histidinol phosphate phosphatase domain-containing protein [Candidatus Saganbacteria bacterium]
MEFHAHSLFSDGALLPAALIREAEIRGHAALAITDHVDASNLEEVIKALVHFEVEMRGRLPIKFIPGVEISYVKPDYIAEYCRKARDLGAKLIVVHGESPAEPVYPGTNHAAVAEKGLADILAHPGNISREEVILAARNGVYLELTARRGHRDGNRHVAETARTFGAKLIVDTDCHGENDLITQEQAFQLCREAGLSDEEALETIKENPQALLKRSGV